MNQPPAVSSSPKDAVGSACPYCRFPLKEQSAMLACPGCRAVHHADCWHDNGGCAVMGCVAAPQGHPAAAAESTTIQAPRAATAAPTAAARGPRRLTPVVALLAILVVGLAGAVGYLASRQAGGPQQTPAATGTPATESRLAADPGDATPEVATDPDESAAATLDDILELSGAGRRLAASDPAKAIANRRRVLRRLRALRFESGPDPALETLRDAIRASIDANEARLAGTDPGAYDARASALKREFVGAVNPFMRRHGFGPYSEASI